MYDLHSEFDIKQHKSHYINYLETIIDPNGKVHYAVPSHQQFMEQYLCKIRNITKQQLCELVPPEYYFDYMTWLCQETGCIAVWNDYYYGKANDAQKHMLLKLKTEGLYSGVIQKSDIPQKW